MPGLELEPPGLVRGLAPVRALAPVLAPEAGVVTVVRDLAPAPVGHGHGPERPFLLDSAVAEGIPAEFGRKDYHQAACN